MVKTGILMALMQDVGVKDTWDVNATTKVAASYVNDEVTQII